MMIKMFTALIMTWIRVTVCNLKRNSCSKVRLKQYYIEEKWAMWTHSIK